MKPKHLLRQDLLYPELSYLIMGCAFDVYNSLGPGYSEKYYQKALMEAFTQKHIAFQSELTMSVTYQNKIIGRKRLDFLVDRKVIVELKKGNNFSKSHIDQVVDYLKMNNLKLAILINFGSSVLYKRIVNMF